MKFDQYQYLWPPRPEKAIPRELIKFYEKKGWVAQAKKNGTCNVLAVSPEREIVAMNRHKEDHKLWTPTAASSAAFKKLPGKGWYVFVTELMHSKVAGGARDTNYINDILVADGVQLVGMTFAERQELLRKLFLTGKEKQTDSYYIINENTWLAKNVDKDLRTFYDNLTSADDEGVVLKNPNAPLVACFRQSDNSNWQVKSRRPHKNYGF